MYANRWKSTLLMGALLLSAMASADVTEETRKAIQTVINKERAAASKKDVKGMFAFHTPDYEAVLKDGSKMNLTQARSAFQGMLPALSSIAMQTAIQKISVQGNQAMVTVKDRAELGMLDAQTGKPGKMVLHSVSEETWVKTAKGWMRKRTRELSSRQERK
jgi:ketosteroid isomerase-like protein